MAVGPRGGTSPLFTVGDDSEDEYHSAVVAALGDKCDRSTPTYPRQDLPNGPQLCFVCCTTAHRVAECRILTEKQREVTRAARATILQNRK